MPPLRNESDMYFFSQTPEVRGEITKGFARICNEVAEARERARREIPKPQLPTLSKDYKKLFL